jgi:hypothetical protein
MDPASALGIAAATSTLIKLLCQSVFEVKNATHGIKELSESTIGFADELDAIHYPLTILDGELRSGKLMREIHGWWDARKLES